MRMSRPRVAVSSEKKGKRRIYISPSFFECWGERKKGQRLIIHQMQVKAISISHIISSLRTSRKPFPLTTRETINVCRIPCHPSLLFPLPPQPLGHFCVTHEKGEREEERASVALASPAFPPSKPKRSIGGREGWKGPFPPLSLSIPPWIWPRGRGRGNYPCFPPCIPGNASVRLYFLEMNSIDERGKSFLPLL